MYVTLFVNFAFISRPFASYPQNYYLCQYLEVFLIWCLLGLSEFQVLHWGVWPILSQFLCRMSKKDQVSIFYMCISSFPIIVSHRCCPWSNVCFLHTWQESAGYRCTDLFLGPCSITSTYMFFLIQCPLLIYLCMSLVSCIACAGLFGIVKRKE